METNRKASYFLSAILCVNYMHCMHFLQTIARCIVFIDAQITVMTHLMYTIMHLIIIIQHFNKHDSEIGNSA